MLILPNATVKHRQRHVVHIVTADLLEAGITEENVNAICYTKGPSMVGHLHSCAVAARMLSISNPLSTIYRT